MLDIGCNAGFYSVEMKRRGAGRVLGIDSDERYLAQARLAAEALGFADIEFRKLSVYDVGALGERFDLVIFMGVLYHLRHPLLALDLIREHVAGDLLLFQTMQRGSDDGARGARGPSVPRARHLRAADCFDDPAYPEAALHRAALRDDWTNWWAPNRACSRGDAARRRLHHRGAARSPKSISAASRRCRIAQMGRRRGLSGQGEPRRVIEAAMIWNEPNNKSHWDPELDPDWSHLSPTW